MAEQYVQRVDESNYVVSAQLIPGRRGRALPIRAYEDPLSEGTIGGFATINHGYKFNYVPSRIRSFRPATNAVNHYANGKNTGDPKPYRFQARRTAEISTRSCS